MTDLKTKSWTITAADSKRINAFETDMYRRMIWICQDKHRTNNSVLKELKLTHHFWQKSKEGNYKSLAM